MLFCELIFGSKVAELCCSFVGFDIGYYFTYRRDTVQTHSKCFLNVAAFTKIKKNSVFYKITQMDSSRFRDKIFNYNTYV